MMILQKTKLSWLLWLAILLSSFAVILSSHHARKQFIEWQGLLKAASAYEVEWGQLLIEKSTMASYARLETVAVGELKMTEPGKEQIVVVRESD